MTMSMVRCQEQIMLVVGGPGRCGEKEMVWKTDPGNRVGEGGADAVQSGREHARPMASEGIYSLPHLPEVSLSAVSVTSNQPQSKNIKWKIPERNNS